MRKELRKILAGLSSAVLLITQVIPVSAEDVEVLEAKALPYGLKGMPAGYKVSARDAELKSKVCSELGNIEALTPGTDYVDGQVIYLADSEEEAVTVAEAYNAELIRYQYGVATAELSGDITVAQAVAVGADTSFDMPLVSINSIIDAEEPIISENVYEDDEVAAPESDDAAFTWQEWREQLNDPALTPCYIFKAKDAANPSYVGYDTKGYQWMHDAVGTYEAWATTMGSKDITVAVIDTGVCDTHEDLKGHTTALNNVIELPGTVCDSSGHGTHVAGIIGATANNGKGGVGIAPGVNLIGIPVFYKSGDSTKCNSSDVASAVMYCAGYDKSGKKVTSTARADIINISLGGYGYNSTYQQAFNEAYKSSITVCVSMANDYTNSIAFPAGYDHVIGVVATNRDNTKAGFSNYGTMADIAAPGVGIFSTWNGHDKIDDKIYETNRTDWYGSWNGTSMASPVVAGVCALYMSAVGHVDPDTMEKVLKENATKLPDKTLGAGLVNVAAMMPDTVKNADPVINYVSFSTGKATVISTSSVTLDNSGCLSISAPNGAAAVCAAVSFDGKDPTIKNGKPGKNTYLYSLEENIYAQWMTNSKTFTMKAALVSTKGTLGRVRSLTVNSTADSGAAKIVVEGSPYVAVGKSVAYTAYRNGDIPKGAKILWSIDEGAPDGVTISKAGKVTVKKGTPVGAKFTVRATASDNSSLSGTYTAVTAEPLTYVYVGFEDGAVNEEVNAPVLDKNGNYKSIRMYTTDIPTTSFVENEIAISFYTSEASNVNITSSNPSVAYFSGGKIYASDAGKTKFTITTTDGTAKKAVLEVNVIVPASDINIVAKNGQQYIAFGKSAQLNAVLGSTYGTPTVKTVNWDYKVTGIYQNANNEKSYQDLTEDFKKNKAITISKTGKVTLKANAPDIRPSVTKNSIKYDFLYASVTVTASTTDGTGLTAQFGMYAYYPVTGMANYTKSQDGFYTVKGNTITVEPAATDESGFYLQTRYITVSVYVYGKFHSLLKSAYIPSSSNPDVAGIVYSDYNSSKNLVYFNIPVRKPGKAKLTIMANDGTGKKLTLTVDSKAK